MDHFNYRNNELFAEDVPVAKIIEQVPTPCYIYSRATLERHWRVFHQAFSDVKHHICFAVKANSNIAVLEILARLGSGFDIVSGGELARVIKATGDPKKVIFSGIGKSTEEIIRALEAEIHCFNIESYVELVRINDIARKLNKIAPISIRINPDIDAGTHPYITTGLKGNKFGVSLAEALAIYRQAKDMSHINILGIAFHIGSQHADLQPFVDALKIIFELIDLLKMEGITLKMLDIGGGMGVRYRDENPPHPHEYAQIVREMLGERNLEIIVEPGRAIAANAGIMVTRVEYLKHSAHRKFAIVDGGMNDLIRPSLYQAWHEILPVRPHHIGQEQCYDIVGPVCESGDFLGKERMMNLQENDLLAVRTAGAYGFVMSSNYNSRPRAAEVMVDQDKFHLIRKRETVEDLYALEQLL